MLTHSPTPKLTLKGAKHWASVVSEKHSVFTRRYIKTGTVCLQQAQKQAMQ